MRPAGRWMPTHRPPAPPPPPPPPLPPVPQPIVAQQVPVEEPVEQRLAAAREAGRADAEAVLRRDLDVARAALEDARILLTQLERTRLSLVRSAAHDVGAVVRRFAERVVGGLLHGDRDALVRIAEEALGRLPERDAVRICVPVGKGDALREGLGPEWADRVVESPAVHLGVVVQTDAVSIDASLGAAMEGLDAAVSAWLGEAPWTSR